MPECGQGELQLLDLEGSDASRSHRLKVSKLVQTKVTSNRSAKVGLHESSFADSVLKTDDHVRVQLVFDSSEGIFHSMKNGQESEEPDHFLS